MIPYKLLQELNKLACTSKNKKIEDLFVKLAEENQLGFYGWLEKIQSKKQNTPIYSALEDQDIIDALIYIKREGKEFPYNVVQLFEHKDVKKYFDFYVIFWHNRNVPKFETILKPLESSLYKFRSLAKGDMKVWTAIEASVTKDLSTLISEYDKFLDPPKPTPTNFDRRELKKRRKDLGLKRPKGRSPHIGDDAEVTEQGHFDRHDFEEGQFGTMSYEQKTRIYRHAFGYLLKGFTDLILRNIKESPHPAWNGTVNLLSSGRLPRYGELTSVLPYIPDMGESGVKGEQLFRKIPTLFKELGDIGAFNQINREVLSALKMSMPVESYEQDNFDYEEWYNAEGDPDKSKDIPDRPMKNMETEQIKMSRQNVLQCEYIFFVSALLGKIQQRIQNT